MNPWMNSLASLWTNPTLFYTVAIVGIVSYLASIPLLYFTVVYVRSCACSKRKILPLAQQVMIVLAHPNDDCIYFGPTIIRLVKDGATVHILCLTVGDSREKRQKRKLELRKACEVLGVNVTYITVLEHAKLKFGITPFVWKPHRIGRVIHSYIEMYSIDTLITFDRGGATGNLDHKSAYYGAMYIKAEGKLPQRCKIYALNSFNLLKQFFWILALPLCLLCSCSKIILLSPEEVRKLNYALQIHSSWCGDWLWKKYKWTNVNLILNNLKAK